jgi:asparagine synthase (glutamine-hydrolysing)
MCGIVAGLCKTPVDIRLVTSALNSTVHRGSDDCGYWSDPDMFLAHTRLSIIGIASGKQPMSSGQIHIAVNGEFYGYKDIIQETGLECITDSDSEILLHLYRKEGIKCLQRLRGEFAAVIADQANKVMLGIRDRFGIKPLFYTVYKDNVYFASEIKALLALGVPPVWNKQAVVQQTYMVRSAHDTMFANIYSVPPGYYAVAQNGKVQLTQYWDSVIQETSKQTKQEMIQEFTGHFTNAVKDRLVADVEVGMYLSGGIDSASVLSIAQQYSSKPIKAFTLAFDNSDYDESLIASKQAKFVGAEFIPVSVNVEDMISSYTDTVWHMEQPFINGHAPAKYLLSLAVRRAGIKVVLTGEGSDELLGGYPSFKHDVGLKIGSSNIISSGLFINDLPQPEETREVTKLLGYNPGWTTAYAYLGQAVKRYYNDDIALVNPYTALADYNPTGTPLGKSLYLNTKFELPNYMLTIAERMETAHTVEGRVPFLDHRLAEYVNTLPDRMKINGIIEKYLLRESMRPYIIEDVYYKDKQLLFTPPAGFTEFYGDILHSEVAKDQPFYNIKKIKNLHKLNAATDSIVNTVVSTIIMQQQFKMRTE